MPLRADDLTYSESKGLAETYSGITPFFNHFLNNKDKKFQGFLDGAPLSGIGITPIFKSKSSQKKGVSFSHPRILSFQGNLIFALVGDPEQKENYETLEVVEILSDGSLIPHKFNFGQGPKKETELIDTPTNCAECHGEPFTFIWRPKMQAGSYEQGFFGGKVKDEYQKFVSAAEQDPRYQPFIKGIKNFEVHAKTDERPENYEAYWESNVSSFLENHNSHRILQQLKSENIHQLRWAVLGAFVDCGNLHDFLPKQVMTEYQQRLGTTLEQTVELTKKSISDEIDKVVSENEALETEFGPGYAHSTDSQAMKAGAAWVGKLRFLIEGSKSKTPIPFNQWSLRAFPRVASYFLTRPQNLLEMFPEVSADSDLSTEFKILYEGKRTVAGQFNQLMDTEVEAVRKKFCETIAPKSVALFQPSANVPEPPPLPIPGSHKPQIK